MFASASTNTAQKLQKRSYSGGVEIGEARMHIGKGLIKSEAEVFDECCGLYGDSISPSQWWKWKQQVRAQDDRKLLIIGMSQATWCLLWVKADALRHNRTHLAMGKRSQLGSLALAQTAISISEAGADWTNLPVHISSRITPQELKRLIEERISRRKFNRRTFLRKGLKSQGVDFYSREQALQIIYQFPHAEKYSYV